MGFDKLATPLAGIPLIRRVVTALAPLRPVLVGPPRLADLVGDLSVRIVLTEPTPGPGATLRLADQAIAPDRHLAVTLADLAWLDARRVLDFLARVPDDADMAWPVVDGIPGHPVIWSPRARGRLGTAGDGSPGRLREGSGLRTAALPSHEWRYVEDLDTPQAWNAAAKRF